jgi:MFS transporter, Spinster family, sphingosine-1-phosphate transporter
MGINVLLFHLLGDALSPTVIGAIAKRCSIAVAIEVNSLPVLAGGLLLLLGPRLVARRQTSSVKA